MSHQFDTSSVHPTPPPRHAMFCLSKVPPVLGRCLAAGALRQSAAACVQHDRVSGSAVCAVLGGIAGIGAVAWHVQHDAEAQGLGAEASINTSPIAAQLNEIAQRLSTIETAMGMGGMGGGDSAAVGRHAQSPAACVWLACWNLAATAGANKALVHALSVNI